MSQKMETTWMDERVSRKCDGFISIKMKANSETAAQFCQICILSTKNLADFSSCPFFQPKCWLVRTRNGMSAIHLAGCSGITNTLVGISGETGSVARISVFIE